MYCSSDQYDLSRTSVVDYLSKYTNKTIPVLTPQGNPPVATALPIAAPPVATAVAMTHFVVARGGPPAVENFSPPVATGGHHKMGYYWKTHRKKI